MAAPLVVWFMLFQSLEFLRLNLRYILQELDPPEPRSARHHNLANIFKTCPMLGKKIAFLNVYAVRDNK